MKIKLLHISFRNFISYGNNLSEIDLNFNKPILITGKNYDSTINGQIDSNGAGKTTILNAICYALYDRSLTTTDKNKLINNINNKNLYVSLIFQKNDLFYKIERYRKNKQMGGDGVKIISSITNDFAEYTDCTLDSMSNTNTFIESLIEMPFELFIRVVVFKASHTSFLNLKAEQQREIVEELFSLTELSEKAETLKESIKNDKMSLNTLTAVNQKILENNTRISNNIAMLLKNVNDWDATHELNISKLQHRANELVNIDFYAEFEKFNQLNTLISDVEKYKTKLLSITREYDIKKSEKQKYDIWMQRQHNDMQGLEEFINSIDSTIFDKDLNILCKLDELYNNMSESQTQLTNLTTNLKKITDNKSLKTNELNKLNESQCPYCNQHFVSNQKIQNVTQDLININNDITTHDDKINELNTNITLLNNQINNYKNGLKYQSLSLLNKEKQLYESAISKLTDLKAQFNPFSDIPENVISEDFKQITSYNDIIKNIENKINNITNTLKYKDRDVIIKMESELQNIHLNIINVKNETNPFILLYKKACLESIEDDNTPAITEMNSQIEHKEFLLKLLTKKDSFIRKALLSKNLNFINSRLKYYLDRIGLPHRVAFNEEMGVSISQFKNEISYEMLSDGQKARVNLALAFSFRDVLQHRYGCIDFCILDECLDIGLGNVGVQSAAKMIKTIALEQKLSMFIISHRDEVMTMFDDKLNVEMRNGMSIIK